MSTAYQTQNVVNKTPALSGHGLSKNRTCLHAKSGTISTWAAGDTLAVGYLPRGAVVTAAVLKAASQLDSNASPTLALDLGISGTAQLFKSAVTTVGHASGATADATINAGGLLYVNPTSNDDTVGSDVEVLVTVHTAAATPVAGTLEVLIDYFVEDATATTP